MKNLGGIVSVVVAAVVASLVAAPSAAAAPPTVAILSGDAALATFEQRSADGCMHTTGQVTVFQLWTLGETTRRGVVATGAREDVCAGTVQPFFGSGEIDALVVGVAFARANGALRVGNDRGDPPFTVAVDLAWVGAGAVSRDGGVVRAPGQVSFTFDATRAATLYGSLVVDGAPAIATGTFLWKTQGSVSL